MPARKSRKVKAATQRKAFVANKKLKGNVPLSDGSDADVDYDDLMHDERYPKDDEVSSEEENLEKLLIKQDEELSEEEEVLPITDDEDSSKEEEEGGDYDEEDDLPNREAWGRKKSAYYNADFVDKDRGKSYREEDAEKARIEAEEASAIYCNLLSYVPQDKDIQITEFETATDISKKTVEEEEDPKSLSKEEKAKYLKRKDPVFFKSIKEYKTMLAEVKDLSAIVKLSKERKLKKEHSDFVENRFQLLLHYTMNMSFYMALKCNDTLTSNHPVVQRIRSYKSLLDNMVEQNEVDILEVYKQIKLDSEKHVETAQLTSKSVKFANAEEAISSEQPASDEPKKKKAKVHFASEEEKNILSLYRSMKEKYMGDEEEDEEEINETPMEEDVSNKDEFSSEMTAEEKRTITREIAKNRGLTVRRKKELRNPRVHNRMKFRKAKIARKGQVREVRREVRRYDGEPTGISSHVVRSIRMK